MGDHDGKKVLIVLVADETREFKVGRRILRGQQARSHAGGKYILLSKHLNSNETLSRDRARLLQGTKSPYYLSSYWEKKISTLSAEQYAGIYRQYVLVEEWEHLQDKKLLGKAFTENPALSGSEAATIVFSALAPGPFEALITRMWVAYARMLEQRDPSYNEAFLTATLELKAFLKILFHVASEDEFAVEFALRVHALSVTPPQTAEYFSYVIPIKYIFWGIEQILTQSQPIDMSDPLAPFRLDRYSFLSGEGIYEKMKQEKSSSDDSMSITNGGIDLNARNLELDIAKEGAEIRMVVDPVALGQFRQGNFSGIMPVIIRITPLQSLLAS